MKVGVVCTRTTPERIDLVGSHVKKTTDQLELQACVMSPEPATPAETRAILHISKH